MLLILLLPVVPSLFLSLIPPFQGVASYFTPHFNRFLEKAYTPPGQMLMERGDFLTYGSFGGKHNSTHEVKQQVF